MNCPYCNKEMVKGIVQSMRPIFFTEKEHKFFIFPDIALKGEISLSSHNRTNPHCVAYNCPDCKKVIIDYFSYSDR